MSYANYLYIAIRAAVDAGKSIMDIYNDPESDFGIERKADNSPLTKADKAAHRLITNALSVTPFPVLSEEGKEIPFKERSKWETLWIVDPLDGTKEFIKRNGEFTVNIAFVQNGVPQAGVIYIPVKQELFFADCTYGAYKIGPITELPAETTLDSLMNQGQRLPYGAPRKNFVIVASRSHLTPETEAYINEMKQCHKQVETVSKGSSLKLCLIAEGEADVYPRFAPTMEWDTAAGHAIIRAAGKEVYQAGRQEPLQYNKEELLNPWFIAQ